VAKINVFASTALPRLPHQAAYLDAFHRSLRDAGEDVEWVQGGYQACDIAVVYGYPKPDSRSAWACRAVYAQHTGPVVIVESPFLGRTPYIEKNGNSRLYPAHPRQAEPG